MFLLMITRQWLNLYKNLNVTLFLIMTLALFLRLYGIHFGLPFEYYWDEPTVIRRAMQFGSGDLNPHFFYYPAFYMYLLFIAQGAYFVVGKFIGSFTSVTDFAAQFFIDPSAFYLVARTITALFSTATVGLLFLVGRRYFSTTVGFLGALFLSVAVIHATHGHIAITDTPHVFFIVAAYLPLYGIIYYDRWRDYLLFAVLVGLGMATKYLALFLLLSLLVAQAGKSTPGPTLPLQWMQRWFSPRLWAVGPVALLTFFLGSPFNFIDFSTFLADMRSQQELSAGGGGNSLTTFLLHMLPATFGWPLYSAAIIGLTFLIWRRRHSDLVFLVFPLFYFLFMARYTVSFPRYLLPVEPFLALTAAIGLTEIGRHLGHLPWLHQLQAKQRWPQAALAGIVLLLFVIPPLTGTMRWNVAMAHEVDPRTVAVMWVESTVAPQSYVAIQGLYNRQFLNAPLMTDEKLATLDKYIPKSGRFLAVRTTVLQTLQTQRIAFREKPFVYDLQALRKHNVELILISDQNWPDVAQGQGKRDTAQALFARDLPREAALLNKIKPNSDLNSSWWGAGGIYAYPLTPPTIEIWRLRDNAQ